MSYYKECLSEFICDWIDYEAEEFGEEEDVESFYKYVQAGKGELAIAYTLSEYVDACDIQVSYDLINQWLIVELNGIGKETPIHTLIIKELPIEKASECLDFNETIWIGNEWICNHGLNEWD